MGPRCPRCDRTDFSFRALHAVHPHPGEFSPSRIICPSCRAVLRVTAISRLVSAFVCLCILAGLIVLAAALGVSLKGWRLAPLIVAWLVVYSISWIYIVRLKSWTPWQYWLPKSRVLGYTVYLGIPVATIVSVFSLAVHFKWGM
jgi:hypothetical protein